MPTASKYIRSAFAADFFLVVFFCGCDFDVSSSATADVRTAFPAPGMLRCALHPREQAEARAFKKGFGTRWPGSLPTLHAGDVKTSRALLEASRSRYPAVAEGVESTQRHSLFHASKSSQHSLCSSWAQVRRGHLKDM